jgi:hypothetical protein
MGVIAQRHQYPEYILEMKASSHTTELRVNTSKSNGVTGTSIWLPISNDLVNQVVDLSGCKGISRAVAQTPQCLTGKVADEGIGKDNKQLMKSVRLRQK